MKENSKDNQKKAKINQGFFGGPTWVEYTPQSQQESSKKLEALDKAIEQAGGFMKFLVNDPSKKMK